MSVWEIGSISPLATSRLWLRMGVVVLIGCVAPTAPAGPSEPRAAAEDPTSEAALIARIKRLSTHKPVDDDEANGLAKQTMIQEGIVSIVDELLARYPKTSFKDEALMAKLSALASLARLHPTYLGQLLSETEAVARGHPAGRLAAESAFYAIQGFVLGARREQMPRPRLLQGTVERYEAFLKDFPRSPRVPVIRASLIRNLIALGRIEQARAEFARLEHDHPDDAATNRARGELYRVVAIGQPFSLSYVAGDGRRIRSADYLGRVVVIHFWATWTPASMEGLPELLDLHQEFADRGLQLIGVNVDKDLDRFAKALAAHKMPWPQYFDGKGFQNEILVSTGVTRLPSFLVVDRKGILRGAGPTPNLRELVKKLLLEK